MAVQLKGAAKLREYLANPDKTIVCPGVHDGLTARMALSVGFDALYMVSTRQGASPRVRRLLVLTPVAPKDGRRYGGVALRSAGPRPHDSRRHGDERGHDCGAGPRRARHRRRRHGLRRAGKQHLVFLIAPFSQGNPRYAPVFFCCWGAGLRVL